MDKFLLWIDAVGGQSNAARLLGVTRGAVNHWVRGRAAVSPEVALRVEKITRGKVKAAELVFRSA